MSLSVRYIRSRSGKEGYFQNLTYQDVIKEKLGLQK